MNTRALPMVFSPAARALAVLAAAFFLFPHNGLAAGIHEFNEHECTYCHGESADGKSWGMKAPAGDISPQCANCHSECDNWPAHRGRKGNVSAMEARLPLLGDGGMSCVTCHSPHGLSADEKPDSRPGLLRLANLKRELCLNCHRGDERENWFVEVTAPPASALVYEEHLPLLGRAEALPGSHLEVQINGAAFPLPVQHGVFHTRLRMQEGLNVVEILFRGERLWRGEIFRASAGDEDENSYGRAFFTHQTQSLAECFGCHWEKDGLLRGDTPEAPGLCYGCHDAFGDKRYLHGPLAVGACTTCHDPHGGKGTSYLRESEVDLCRSCHRDQEVLGHDGGRRALADGSCSSCHDPHQSNGRFLTRQADLRHP